MSPLTGTFFYHDYSHSVNIINSTQISFSRQFTTIKSNLCLFLWREGCLDVLCNSYNQPSDSSNVWGSCLMYNSAAILFGCVITCYSVFQLCFYASLMVVWMFATHCSPSDSPISQVGKVKCRNQSCHLVKEGKYIEDFFQISYYWMQTNSG